MSLPKQVQEAAEKAKLAEEQFRSQGNEEVVESNISEQFDAPSEDTALEQPSVDEADSLSFLTDSKDEVTDVEEDTSVEPDNINENSDNDLQEQLRIALERAEKSDQRYNSLQGKYNKEGKEMRSDLSEMKGKLDAFAMMNSNNKVEAETESDPFSYLDPKLKEEYDEDLLKVADQIASHKIAGMEAKFNDQLNQITSKQEDTENKNYKDKLASDFEKEVMARVPNWMEITSTDAFYDWLDSKTLYGKSLANINQGFYDNYDVEGFSGILLEYVNSNTSEKKESPKGKLDVPADQISPPQASKTRTAPKSNTLPTYTMKEIKAFSKNEIHKISEGRASFRGKRLTAKEASLLNKDMSKALTQGRVR